MKHFFSPGPAALYPTVEAHLATAMQEQLFSYSHRSKIFEAMYQEAEQGLRRILDIPENFSVLFFASATEIWERLLQNCVEQQSYHFVNGSFSDRFFNAAQSLGLEAQAQVADWGQGFADAQLAEAVSGEMINFTLNETSTGTHLPWELIRACRMRLPESLITLDMVSNVPYTVLEWDTLDAAYFSVQKGMGLPAGLGVLIANERVFAKAKQKQDKGFSIGTYHSFLAMQKKAKSSQTVETPNMLGIYLLGKVCQDMLAKGITHIRTEMKARAEAIYALLEAHRDFEIFVAEPALRSDTVIVAEVRGGSSNALEYFFRQGLILGSGYGKMKTTQIRIANFPAVTKEGYQKLLESLRAYSVPED